MCAVRTFIEKTTREREREAKFADGEQITFLEEGILETKKAECFGRHRD
jgi:hypothetical protein